MSGQLGWGNGGTPFQAGNVAKSPFAPVPGGAGDADGFTPVGPKKWGNAMVWDCMQCGAWTFANKDSCFRCSAKVHTAAKLQGPEQAKFRRLDGQRARRQVPAPAGDPKPSKGGAGGSQRKPQKGPEMAAPGPQAMEVEGDASLKQVMEKLRNLRQLAAQAKSSGLGDTVEMLQGQIKAAEKERDALRPPQARLQAAAQCFQTAEVKLTVEMSDLADLEEQVEAAKAR
eukprot:15484476-Alexandrium_andersonii.AAC.1